jgi:hypothetical protein
MAGHALMCPQCNAPLAPHKFARSIVCSYCGATIQLDETSVSAELFHQAYRTWNSPQSYPFPAWISIGDSHWALGSLVAHGSTKDVYSGRRARWPTELAILKILRVPGQSECLEREWKTLQLLLKSTAPGADNATRLIPQPIIHGDITAGTFQGSRASVFRRASGFHHTFEEVMRVYPNGIPARASIWVWRRILEVLSFIHASGMVHGAVLPPHLLVQENEHGVRLVGYGAAGSIGDKAQKAPSGYEAYQLNATRLTPQLDLVMSARCMAALLGGDPATGDLPESVPSRLERVVRRVALSEPDGRQSDDAWALREELGAVADAVFGPPKFTPIVMPV